MATRRLIPTVSGCPRLEIEELVETSGRGFRTWLCGRARLRRLRPVRRWGSLSRTRGDGGTGVLRPPPTAPSLGPSRTLWSSTPSCPTAGHGPSSRHLLAARRPRVHPSRHRGAGPDRPAEGPGPIAIDEVKYKKGHKYLTVVCDHLTGTVIWAARGRNKDTRIPLRSPSLGRHRPPDAVHWCRTEGAWRLRHPWKSQKGRKSGSAHEKFLSRQRMPLQSRLGLIPQAT